MRCYEEQERGLSSKEAARLLKVAPSTMDRWKSELFYRPDPFALDDEGMSVNEAISVLSSADSGDGSHSAHLRRVEAVATFVAWLRWPRFKTSQRLGVLSYVTAYLRGKFGKRYIYELDSDTQHFIEKFLRLDFIATACSSRNIYFPVFDRFYGIEGMPQDENACLADIAWYLMAHRHKVQGSRGAASLGKAVYVANRNGFKYKWSASSFSLWKLIRDRLPAAPFIYAEYQGKISIPWNIDVDDICSEVDEFLLDKESVRAFFARACWIIEDYKARLDRKALDSLAFPLFPLGLEPERFQVPPLTEKILSVLRRYRSADKTLNWQGNFCDED